jgi:hypothetical protein
MYMSNVHSAAKHKTTPDHQTPNEIINMLCHIAAVGAAPVAMLWCYKFIMY